MEKEKSKKKRLIEHPLEETFNIERGTTEVVSTEISTELVEYDEYDEKDQELEEQYQDVHDKAMEMYERMQDELEDCDGKYYARISEVSLSALGMALGSIKEKTSLKKDKDKLLQKAKGNEGNNNLVINTRDLIKMLKEQDEEKTVEHEEVEEAEFEEFEEFEEDNNDKE